VNTDMLVPGDYDGDGKTDYAIYRPSTRTWWIQQSQFNYTTVMSFTGATNGAVPVVADFDGDGKTDIATFSESGWNIVFSAGNYTGGVTLTLGLETDSPLPQHP